MPALASIPATETLPAVRSIDGEGRRLTDMQAAFVVAFTTDPAAIGNAAAAARLAGYSENSAKDLGRRLVDLPHVQGAIREANQRLISSTLATKAVSLLQKVIDDEEAPLKCRVDAAKTVLDRAGYAALPPTAPNRLSAKHLTEMTADELRDVMLQMKAEMDKAKIIDQPSVADAAPIVAEAVTIDSTCDESEGTRP